MLTHTSATSGVSLSWYGYIPNSALSPALATYSIDGQTAINFQVNGLSTNTASFYNQKFFETAQLTAGPHTLEVVNGVNSNTTALSLSFLIVQNGTLPSSISSHLPSSTAGSSTSGTSAPVRSSTPVGAIVGGVIGGLALTVFVIFGFLFLRRRHQHVTQEKVLISTPEPFDYTPVHPSSITPNPSLPLGRSHSPAPQTTQVGVPVTKGQVYQLTPTDLRPVPLQQSLTMTNPSPSPSVPSSPPSREGEQGLLPPAPLQNNDIWPSAVPHTDSGIRMPSSTAGTSAGDIPPLYTFD